MQTTFFIAAAILYAVCALLPSPRGAVISGVTALAWVLHGAALWPDMLANGALRIGSILEWNAIYGQVCLE